MAHLSYEALLLVSFGGPEKPEDVMPFLERVVRGRNVPRTRLLEVAEHYQHFGGKSPINDHNRALLRAAESELAREGIALPVYWGNRNWDPLLEDTVRQMAEDGVRQALALVTSAYGSHSGCRQYLDDLDRARAAVGPRAPVIHKLRAFFNHPGFIGAMGERVRSAFDELAPSMREDARLVFTAHSIPVSMADTSPYREQVKEACRLVAQEVGRAEWDLAWQSRSGPPQVPWLEPDIGDHLEELARRGHSAVVLAAIGFLSDHMEVVFDLDVEAKARAEELGLSLVRSGTVGTHPQFVAMIPELIRERTDPEHPRRALGPMGAAADTCEPDCCPGPPPRPQAAKRT